MGIESKRLGWLLGCTLVSAALIAAGACSGGEFGDGDRDSDVPGADAEQPPSPPRISTDATLLDFAP